MPPNSRDVGQNPKIGRAASPLRILTILCVALAAPIVPALIAGEFFSDLANDWQQDPPSKLVLACGIAGVLAADILLPVPSGPVSTLAGATLGVVMGTLTCWLGMSVGALGAFALVRRYGSKALATQALETELESLGKRWQNHSTWLLLATRPAPVLAEATVLLAALVRMPWRQFALPVLAGNFCVACAFASAGYWAASRTALLVAVVASALLPMVFTIVLRRCFRRPLTKTTTECTPTS